MSNTPTPRTDLFMCANCCDIEHCADFARQLERELAEAQSQISALQQHIATGRSWNAPDSLLAENAELREQLAKESTHACNLVSRLSDEQEKTWNLERELAEAQDQAHIWEKRYNEMIATCQQAGRERDNALSDYRQADTDSIRALHARNEARAQRDALAVLAGELIAAIRVNYQYRGYAAATTEQIDAYIQPFETSLKSALAASAT